MSDITVETSSHLTNSLTRENASHGTEELLGHLNIAVTRSVEINANARSCSSFSRMKPLFSGFLCWVSLSPVGRESEHY